MEEIINLGEFWNSEKLLPHKEFILSASNKKATCYHQAYKNLENAYKEYSEFEGAQGLTDGEIRDQVLKWADQIFTSRAPVLRQMFAGAITPEGLVHYTNEITAKCLKKLAITEGKVRDKSRFIHQLALLALEKGFDVDLYHCFYSPDRYTMVVIPQIKTVVLDNNISYLDEVLPKKEISHEISFGEDGGKPGEAFYKQINKAVSLLKDAKTNHENLERHYVQAMNYEGVDKTRENILSQILKIASRADKK
ncbi:hypothetical protein GGQ84_002145 [Desulfitispora alkaliphila]|uniref:hypothetical protein n=1 Tax=Desulfitispora alkaliphila TaxID=622674 RepID=UPI003D190C71